MERSRKQGQGILFVLLAITSAFLGAEAQEVHPLPPEASSRASGPPAAASRAEEALRAGNSVKAIEEYRALTTADPLNSQAWTGLGVLLYGSGRAAEAREALQRALQLDPATPRAELFLSFAQADLRDCDQAIPVLKVHFAREPVGKLQRLIGLTLLSCAGTQADTSVALATVSQLKRDYPADADVLYQSAQLYTRLWNESANELLAAHPDSYRVHQLAAEVNEAQGNLSQAIRQYKAALGQNPKLPQMHYHIGQLLLKAGEADADERAMTEFRAELVINPQSAVSALAMAEIEQHQGHTGEAIADYKLALRLEPDLAEARVGLARSMLTEHQVEASQAELRPLLTAHPENAQAHYVMMLAYREQGKLPEAAIEMETFRHLQQGAASDFNKKLNALLSGDQAQSAGAPSAIPAPVSTPQ